MRAHYHKAGLLAIREGRILLCRKKHGSSLWILPGGCIEPGETPDACLRRELLEELGAVEPAAFAFVGTYRDTATGDATKLVQVELFQADLRGEPSPHSEIAELTWFGPEDDRAALAPSIANKILPDLLRRGILPWPA